MKQFAAKMTEAVVDCVYEVLNSMPIDDLMMLLSDEPPKTPKKIAVKTASVKAPKQKKAKKEKTPPPPLEKATFLQAQKAEMKLRKVLGSPDWLNGIGIAGTTGKGFHISVRVIRGQLDEVPTLPDRIGNVRVTVEERDIARALKMRTGTPKTVKAAAPKVDGTLRGTLTEVDGRYVLRVGEKTYRSKRRRDLMFFARTNNVQVTEKTVPIQLFTIN